MRKPKQALLVVWEDSNVTRGWHDQDDTTYHPSTVMTIGWLIHENRNCITVASSAIFQKGNQQVTDPMTIPRGCIQSMAWIDMP